MKPNYFLWPLPTMVFFMGLSACPLRADPVTLPQAQVSLTQGAAGTWNLDWQGVEHRVYFMQWSLDLVTWNNCPSIKFGAGLLHQGCNSSTAKFFIRLMYYDDPTIETLEQAQSSDYDGDHVSNLDEVQAGLNPFSAMDSDADSMADDWERFWFAGSLSHDGLANGDGDEFTDAEEYALGLNPTVNESVTSARSISYDPVGRLNVSGTVAAAYDEEGNIKSSNN